MSRNLVRSHRASMRHRLIALGASACLAGLSACVGGDDDGAAPTDTTSAPESIASPISPAPSIPSTTVPPSTSDPTTTTTSSTTTSPSTTPTTSSTTTSPSTTTTTSPSTTTTTSTTEPTGREGFVPAPDDLLTVPIDVPAGDLIAAPGDYVALRADGDLEYHPNGLAPAPSNRAAPITLVERADPRQEPAEGPGPNVIDDVAGIVDGSLIYGDCCEPVSGNVWAADEAGGEVGPVAVGHVPGISPSGDHLAIVNDMQLSVFDLTAGEGQAIRLNDDPDEGYVSYRDLQWLDDETFAVITYRDDRHQIVRYDAATLAASLDRVNLGDDVDLPGVRFTGLTPEGELTVSIDGPSGVTVRYLAPGSLEELGELEQTFPPTVGRIETDRGGLGQLWVDRGTLYHRPPTSITADPLLDDVLAAWFLTP